MLVKISFLFCHSVPVCKTVVDLGFLIDGSGSIEYRGRGNFRLMLDFIKSIVVTIPISRTQSRVGAVLFSTRPIPLFRFGQLNTFTHIKQVIDNIRYPRGSTYIGKALAFTRRYLFSGRRRRNQAYSCHAYRRNISRSRVQAGSVTKGTRRGGFCCWYRKSAEETPAAANRKR